jgi:hypothetical protein
MSNSSVSDQIGSRVGLPARRTLQREFGLLVEAVEERMDDPCARRTLSDLTSHKYSFGCWGRHDT